MGLKGLILDSRRVFHPSPLAWEQIKGAWSRTRLKSSVRFFCGVRVSVVARVWAPVCAPPRRVRVPDELQAARHGRRAWACAVRARSMISDPVCFRTSWYGGKAHGACFLLYFTSRNISFLNNSNGWSKVCLLHRMQVRVYYFKGRDSRSQR